MLPSGAALGSGLRALTESKLNTGSLGFAEDFLGMEGCGHKGVPEACCWLARHWRWVTPATWVLWRPVSQADRAVLPADVPSSSAPSSRKCW